MKCEINCKNCNRKPEEIYEYEISSKIEGVTPIQYVIQEEGTYNPKTGKFYCTKCYIELGMPTGIA